MVFARLHYPETLIENTIRHFIEMRVTENVCSKQQVSEEQDAHIRIVLPFKDQKSANAVRHQLSDLVERLKSSSSLSIWVKRSRDISKLN